MFKRRISLTGGPHRHSAQIDWLTRLRRGAKIYQDLLISLRQAKTIEEVGVVLAEIQAMSGFRYYYVFDTSRVEEEEPISFLFPSNIPAELFYKVEDRLATFVFRLSSHLPGALGPMPWEMAETEADGDIAPDAASMFRAAGVARAISFPALGISGAPRIIGFAGNRAPLDEGEITRLSQLMFQVHVRLGVIERAKTEKRRPLSGLERQVLFLAVEGESFDTIAEKLALSSITIGYLISSICGKMEVETFEHAVAVTLRRGLTR